MQGPRPNPGNEVYGSVYEKNHVIFCQGDSGGCMYLFQSGAVEISQHHGGGETVLAILGKGDFFREMALISRQPRSATVIAIQHSRLLHLSRALLLGKMRQAMDQRRCPELLFLTCTGDAEAKGFLVFDRQKNVIHRFEKIGFENQVDEIRADWTFAKFTYLKFREFLDRTQPYFEVASYTQSQSSGGGVCR